MIYQRKSYGLRRESEYIQLNRMIYQRKPDCLWRESEYIQLNRMIYQRKSYGLRRESEYLQLNRAIYQRKPDGLRRESEYLQLNRICGRSQSPNGRLLAERQRRVRRVKRLGSGPQKKPLCAVAQNGFRIKQGANPLNAD
jgi:hypothetical protein